MGHSPRQATRFSPLQFRHQRARRKLSHQMLARRVGYSRQMIQQVEAGRTRPSLQLLERVADACQVDIRRFFAA